MRLWIVHFRAHLRAKVLDPEELRPLRSTQIPNSKHQIPNKSQIPNTNDLNYFGLFPKNPIIDFLIGIQRHFPETNKDDLMDGLIRAKE